jgi:hypothetical protein
MNTTKRTTMSLVTMFAIITTAALLTASTIVIPSAFALTRYFNCTTGIANKTGKLTLDDVNLCYDKKFPSKLHNDGASSTTTAKESLVASPSKSLASAGHDHSRSKVSSVEPDLTFQSIPR